MKAWTVRQTLQSLQVLNHPDPAARWGSRRDRGELLRALQLVNIVTAAWFMRRSVSAQQYGRRGQTQVSMRPFGSHQSLRRFWTLIPGGKMVSDMRIMLKCWPGNGPITLTATVAGKRREVGWVSRPPILLRQGRLTL